ncbi:hypothetical protein NDU88_004588 [Pleurodeles waltl]|uniref:Uncharacterized protein n=1 Tax=Pleurodeles waltl TaxID=8319 RepID=A0AAV7QG11_PLEWA|nr:hypothetical protein NDU88_004588 [Pleurodeles waltl]
MANPATNWTGVWGRTRRVWRLQQGQTWTGQTSVSLSHGYVGFCVPGHAEAEQRARYSGWVKDVTGNRCRGHERGEKRTVVGKGQRKDPGTEP